ncbi:MAG: hypothetical protein KTR32_20505 [Granulosicoccus sp.]|nr:hypothetical protein [Granulosicoccus sp.]
MIADDEETAMATSSDRDKRQDAENEQRRRELQNAKAPLGDESAADQVPDPANSVKPIDLAGDMQDLSEHERESRRHALRSMLEASEARYQGAMKSKRPTLAIGERLQVASGPYRNLIGNVLDADFIHSRVFLQLEDIDEPQWIEFARIASTLPD